MLATSNTIVLCHDVSSITAKVLWPKPLQGCLLVTGHQESQANDLATDQGSLRTMLCYHMPCGSWTTAKLGIHSWLASAGQWAHTSRLFNKVTEIKAFFFFYNIHWQGTELLPKHTSSNVILMPICYSFIFFFHSCRLTPISVTFERHMARAQHC